MIVKIFTIYDSKAEAYLQPFFMTAVGAAIRAITALVNNPEHDFYKYAGDYTLFHIGEFDDATAIVSSLPNFVNLGCIIEFKHSADLHSVVVNARKLGANV